MSSRGTMLWAELSRAGQTVRVLEMGWRHVMMFGRSEGTEAWGWNEREECWEVPEGGAAALLKAAVNTHFVDYLRTLVHFDRGVLRGTSAADVLTSEGAKRVRDDLITFLQGGAFSWRFVPGDAP